jgi:hypothetical protein
MVLERARDRRRAKTASLRAGTRLVKWNPLRETRRGVGFSQRKDFFSEFVDGWWVVERKQHEVEVSLKCS